MEATPMRSLPDHVYGIPAIPSRSIASAITPFLGIPAGSAGARRLEDAAITLLAAVYQQAGPVREQLVCERPHFDRLLYAVNRCQPSRGGS
jgi:hypothetical protein